MKTKIEINLTDAIADLECPDRPTDVLVHFSGGSGWQSMRGFLKQSGDGPILLSVTADDPHCDGDLEATEADVDTFLARSRDMFIRDRAGDPRHVELGFSTLVRKLRLPGDPDRRVDLVYDRDTSVQVQPATHHEPPQLELVSRDPGLQPSAALRPGDCFGAHRLGERVLEIVPGPRIAPATPRRARAAPGRWL